MTSMASLALPYLKQGRWKEAEELLMQVMEARKRVLGQEHPDTLTSIAVLEMLPGRSASDVADDRDDGMR